MVAIIALHRYTTMEARFLGHNITRRDFTRLHAKCIDKVKSHTCKLKLAFIYHFQSVVKAVVCKGDRFSGRYRTPKCHYQDKYNLILHQNTLGYALSYR